MHRVGLERLEAGAEADLDAAAAKLADGVVGELRVDLGKHAIGGLDQDPAHPVKPGARVALHRVGREVLELGERLEARVAAADEDVGEQLWRRAGSSLAFAASSVSITWLRSQIASARLLKPIACSRPGTGKRRETEPEREQELVVALLRDLALVWSVISTVRAAGSCAVTAPRRR